MREEGDRGILWRGGCWELFSIAVLSLSFPSAPSCFFRLEEGAGQGCSGGETGEEGMGGSLTECRGPMGKVQTLSLPLSCRRGLPTPARTFHPWSLWQ